MIEVWLTVLAILLTGLGVWRACLWYWTERPTAPPDPPPAPRPAHGGAYGYSRAPLYGNPDVQTRRLPGLTATDLAALRQLPIPEENER